MVDLKETLELLKIYGNENTIEHSYRVHFYFMEYINNIFGYAYENVKEDPRLSQLRNYGSSLSLLHDLWEDAKLPKNFTSDKYLLNLMDLISMNSVEQTYEEYIYNIKNNAIKYPEAYYVKLADIKDHLMLKDTLTDRLKEKYIGALRILL